MPGTFLKYGPHILLNNFKPTNGLYYASTETALRSNSYMSGAVWSGETVAKQIMAELNGTMPERDPMMHEQAMKFCVERVIKAVQMQNPMMEFSVISQNCVFDAPGGQALSGTYTGQQGTIEFFVTLGSLVTITRFNVEGITLNEAKTCAFARISVSGHSNVTGTSFAGLTGTMAFLFNDPSEAKVVIAKDMFLFDTPLADEVILGVPQTVPPTPLPLPLHLRVASARNSILRKSRHRWGSRPVGRLSWKRPSSWAPAARFHRMVPTSGRRNGRPSALK